jgi:hypothetical protein
MVKRMCTIPTGDAPPHAAKYQRVDSSGKQRISYTHKVPRVRTDQYVRPYTTESPSEIETAQREIYKILLDRLHQAQTPLNHATVASMNFLWPSTRPDLWLKLLNHPLTVTDEELSTILELEDSTSQTPGPNLGNQTYYMRSFKLQVRDLRWIAARLFKEGRHIEQSIAWSNAVKFIKNDRQRVHVRYIGTSTVVSAHRRFTQDSFNRKSGLYGYFSAMLLEYLRESMCSICTFSEATTRSFGSINGLLFRLHADHTDIREQALIALFSRSVLLNRQVGGLSVAYQPQQKAIMRFEALGTQVASKFLPEMSLGYAEPTTKIRKLVTAWMEQVAKLSNAHPTDLGTDKMPITTAMKKAWADQATPCTFYGKVVAVFIGDYCAIAAMQNPGSFWRQYCCACKYLKDTLARLMAFEGGESRWKPEDLNIFADNAILSWVDYRYTTKRDAFRWESAELMRQYLDAVRPLIVPSFEHGVLSVLREDFGALYHEHEFSPMVGVPEIHFHNHRGEIFNKGKKAIRAEFPVVADELHTHPKHP